MINLRKFFSNETLNSMRNLLNSKSFFISVKNSNTKSLEEKIGLPPKPKRPLTPYFRFMKEIRPNVVAENPNAGTTDIVKIIANKWKSTDENLKKKLEEEYKKDQIAYIEKRAKYESKITNSQKEDLKHLKQELAEAKERRTLKKRIRELGKPKRPASPFLKFIMNERINSPPPKDYSVKEWVKKCTEKWGRLSDTEKEKYLKEFKVDLEKYKDELTKWEGKMIRLGNIDIVRKDPLIESHKKA